MTKINWHPYPETKPKKDGIYLVTTLAGDVDTDAFQLGDFDFYMSEVIAWAELPEPYNPPKPIDNHPDAVTTRKYMAGDPETVKALHIFDE